MGGVASTGARDNNRFRECIGKSKLEETSITYEGVLNEYSYGIGEEFEFIFNTSYSTAIVKNVYDSKYEHYLCLEMKSKYDGEGLERNGGRPSMNFSFALDISGSMGSPFAYKEQKTKLQVAQECLVNLLSKLHPDDRFGLITFDDNAETLLELKYVKDTDMSEAKRKIMETKVRGGTDIGKGLKHAASLLLNNKERDDRSNRLFFLTDMNPTHGNVNIFEEAQKLASSGVHLSIVGLGVDFNSKMTQELAKVRGCNSFGVTSAAAFRKQMNEDFDASSMLICYDVSLKLPFSSEFEVEEIYGSPLEPNKSIGEILKLDSINPSPICSDGGIKGGIVVLKLKRKNPESHSGETLKLDLSYTDWEDNKFQQASEFQFPDDPQSGDDYYQNNSARKAVDLVRYVKIMKEYLQITDDTQYASFTERLQKFKEYLTSEIQVLQDTTMDKDIEVIDSVIKMHQPAEVKGEIASA